jgi:biopolymer transport protein ExbB
MMRARCETTPASPGGFRDLLRKPCAPLRQTLVVAGLVLALTASVAAQTPAAPPAGAQSAAPPASAGVAVSAAEERPASEPARVASQKAAGSLPSALPSDLSPWGMFLHANFVVQIVMTGLALASLVTWTIWLAKSIELWTARRTARGGLETLANASSLRAAEKSFADPASPIALFVRAATGEEERSAGLPAEGVKERVGALLSRLEAHAGRKMARGTAIIATIGATAPFIGLFGTVWGIMDSFIGISRTHTTNLAVVAPGIAEALLATAMGLVAAIPAVMIYNAFARSVTGYRALLGDAATEVLRHVSRDLDRETTSRPKDDGRVIAMRRPAE